MVFVLMRLHDTVHIVPGEFAKPTLTAITDALNKKFCNKVLLLLSAARPAAGARSNENTIRT